MSYDYIDGERFARLAGIGWNETGGSNGIYYAQTHHIDWTHVRERLDACTIILHNSDLLFDDALAAAIPPNVKRVFAVSCQTTHPKCQGIPFGVLIRNDTASAFESARQRLTQCQSPPKGKRKGKPEPRPIVHLCVTADNRFLPEASRAQRAALYARFASIPWATCRNAGMPYPDYLAEMVRHRYVLCPAGTSPDTHRFWEAFYLGCIPIAIRHPVMRWFDALPALWVDSFDEVTEERLQAEYKALRERLALSPPQLQFGIWKQTIGGQQ